MFYVNVTTATGTTGRLVEGESLTGGRSEDSELVISHETLSRRHMVLMQRDGEIYVEDLGSSNGTFLNGERLLKRTPIPLGPTDVVSMGEADVKLSVALAATREADAPVVARALRGVDSASPTRAVTLNDNDLGLGDPTLGAMPDEASPYRPHVISGAIGAGLSLVIVLIYHLLQGSPEPVPPPPAPVASVPETVVPIVRVPTAVGYRATYLENVSSVPGFARKYLGEEFQRRLTKEMVPAAARAWRLDETRVVQALGVTAELVKSLEDRRNAAGETAAERADSMRRLEADARAQLSELLGGPARVTALMQMEKPIFER